MIVSVAPGGGSRGSDMIVSVAAAGMLMATAAEASLGCEKKRKKRAPRGGLERATFGALRDIGVTL